MTLKAWLWRLILSHHHLLPLFPSIPFFQAKSFFRYLYRQALSCLKVYEQSPAWYSICMECCTPTQVMAGWLLSVFQDNLKINVTSLARFFLILPPFSPTTLPLSPLFSFLASCYFSSQKFYYVVIILFACLLGLCPSLGEGRDMVGYFCFMLCLQYLVHLPLYRSHAKIQRMNEWKNETHVSTIAKI